MGNPRKPLALAKIDGSAKKNPKRYRGLNEPTIESPLGDPPDYLVDTPDNKARQAWLIFATEAPFLNASHRALVETASLIRGEIVAGVMPGIQRLNLLKQCLQQLGLTPTTASKVATPDTPEDDPDDEFFR